MSTAFRNGSVQTVEPYSCLAPVRLITAPLWGAARQGCSNQVAGTEPSEEVRNFATLRRKHGATASLALTAPTAENMVLESQKAQQQPSRTEREREGASDRDTDQFLSPFLHLPHGTQIPPVSSPSRAFYSLIDANEDCYNTMSC